MSSPVTSAVAARARDRAMSSVAVDRATPRRVSRERSMPGPARAAP